VANTLADFDRLLTEAGVPPLDQSGPQRDPFTLQGTRGFYAPEVPQGLVGDDFLNEYKRQARLTADQRVAEGTVNVKPEEQRGEFNKGLQAGIDQVQALVLGGGAALADVFGLESARDSLIQGYLEQMQQGSAYEPTVHGVEGITDLKSFADWAAFTTGEQIPTILSILASGGITGLLGRAVAKKTVTATAAKLAEGQARQLVAAAARKGMERGIIAGSYLGASTLETGGVLGEQVEAGLEPRGGVALTAGFGAAGPLEIAVPLLLAKAFGLTGGLGSAFARRLLSSPSRAVRAGTLGTAASITELGTETAQEVVAIAARDFVDENFDALGPESASHASAAASDARDRCRDRSPHRRR
jgi:hypothetical protein